MTDDGPIVVGVDGSRGSSAATRFALHEAQRLGAGVHLVHVVPGLVPVSPMLPLLPLDLRETGHVILRDAVQEACEAAPTVPITSALLEGSRVTALLQASDDALMIALGHERHTTIDRLMTGATVTGVAASADCPVVAVHPDWTPEREHECVLVGLKSTTDSPALLHRAFETADARDSRLLIVHVWELPMVYDDLVAARGQETGWQDRAREEIERATLGCRSDFPEVPVEIRILHGQPARELQRLSGEADVLVLARRAHVFPVGHLGATARALLRHSVCPVAVVPPAIAPDDDLDLVLEQSGAIRK
jgi:nucleotide-binding universal stress UspA family protein